MANIIINPKDDKSERVSKLFEFVKDGQFYCAVAYAKVCKLREDEYNKVNNTNDDYFNKLYTVFAYAFDDPWYDYEKVYDNFNFKDKKIEDKDFSSFFSSSEYKYFIYLLFLSIAVRSLYSKKVGDWKFLQEQLPKDNNCYDKKIRDVVEKLLKDVIEDIENFKKVTGQVLIRFADKKQSFKNINNDVNTIEKAKKDLENLRNTFSKCDTDLENEIRKDIFGDSGLVYTFYKQAIKTQNTDILWEEVYQENFLDDDLNVDFSKIESFVKNIYKEKLKKLGKNTKNSEKSDEYDNILDDLNKFLSEILSFLNKCEADSSNINIIVDKADKKYIDECDDYVEHLNTAIKKLKEEKSDKTDIGYIVGICSLEYLLEYIKDSISMKIEEENYKYEYGNYFYIPFLLSNSVMLNDQFLPNFPDFYEKEQKISNSFIKSIQPEYRIEKHAEDVKDFNYTVGNFKQELRYRQNIKNKYNYYSKELITKYDDSSSLNENIRDREKAAERASNKLYDFQGELELALWYRQLEQLQIKEELNKESEYNAYKLYLNIRNNTEKFYNILCKRSSNYDFFHKIVDGYLGYIKEKINILKQDCLKEFKLINDDKDVSHKEKAFFEEFYDIVNKKINDNDFTFEKLLQDFSEDEYREDKYKEIRDFFEGFYNIVFRQKNFSSVSVFLKNFKDCNWSKLTFDNLDDYLYKFMDDQMYNDCLNSAEIYDDETSLESKVVLGGNCLNKSEAKKLAKDWDNIFLSKKSKIDSQLLKDILDDLGFDLNEIKRDSEISFLSRDENQTFLNNFVIKLSTKKFKHPIAAFGSDAIDKNFKVICIDSHKINDNTVDYLINFIENIGTDFHTIILFDYALTLQDRRTLAKKIKTKINSNGEKNTLFLVVDRVAMSFLMKRYNPSKINDMFLSILSPFGFYQPYKSSIGFGASEKNSLDEMFIGRKYELEKIKNTDVSINIVYGGRQLGKSSLLQKAARDVNAKNDSNRAVYIYLTRNDKTSKDSSKTYYIKVLDTIVSKMKEAKVFDNDVKINNWEDFGKEVTNSLKSDKKDISSLVLLIDEADDFFEICDKDNNDIPFDTFSQIVKNVADFEKKKTFKVVFAGLNMIKDYKFLNQGNHFGGQLDSDKTKNGKYYIPIVPFNDKEARELIEKPLHYLGLYFSQDSESLIYLILDKTNYYPCLIQLYCEKLLKEMCKEDYAHYKEEKDPVYYVNEKHIKKVLSDKGFLETVKQKFDITLDLSPTDSKADHTYRYLAVILAYLCHNREEGYSSYNVDDFVNVAKEYEIKHICELNEQKNEKDENGEEKDEKVSSKLELYMDHLVELSVFSCEKEKEGDKIVKRYGFRRLPLFQLMGSKEEIDDAIASFSFEAN